MLRFLFNWRLIAAVIIVAAIVTMAMWPETVEVDVTRVSRGDLLVTIDEEGETRVRRSFVIAAPVAGRLQRIELEPGDPVRRGVTLARLTPAVPTLLDARERAELAASVEAATAALGQARANRERAAAALERARSAVERRRGLVEEGIVSRDEFEADEATMKAAEEDLRSAEFAVERGQHELEMARARLQPPAAGGAAIAVASPIDGVVLRRHRESEADVPAGEPLLEIGDPSDLEIVSDLLSTDAVRVSPGDRVLIEQWGGDVPLEGRVRRIEPSGFVKTSALGVEEQRVNVIIDFAEVEGPPQALGDGYRVEVRVVVAEVRKALTLPLGALFRQGESWFVFTIEEEQARLREVQVGRRNDLEAEIVSGLSEGDAVIVHPPDILADGVKVSERQTSSGL